VQVSYNARPAAAVILLIFAAFPAGIAADTAQAELPPPVSALRWTPEQTIVGFRHIEEIFPTRTVPNADQALPLPTAAEIDIHFDFNGAHYDTRGYMQAHRLTGVLVVKDGQVLLERYAHARGEDDLWASFSVAKSVTSTLVGAAIADGYIQSLDEPVSRYIPEMAGSAYEDVEIRHLLTMTSGVQWNEDYGDPESDIGRIYNTPATEPNLNPVISYMRQLPRAHPPGTQFNYSTGETDLAGFVVSRATGKSLADYLAEKIWQPFGMEQNAVWQLDSEGHERGGCCLAVTLRDYARLGLFMLGHGRAGDDDVLPKDWVEAATRNQLRERFPNGGGYGYFWWIQPDGAYQAVGIYGQMIHIVPEQSLVIVTNAAWPATGGQEFGGARQAFVNAVRDAVR
jgi:CubicO group peptidase (beta-lactamase class C family)